MPRFQPNNFGIRDLDPAGEADDVGVAEPQPRRSVTAIDRVTTATLRPRTRSAGSPISTPITVATSADISGAIGNGMSHEIVK